MFSLSSYHLTTLSLSHTVREIEARHAAAEHALERQIAALRADEPQRMQQLRAEQEQVRYHSEYTKRKFFFSFFHQISGFRQFVFVKIFLLSNLYSRNALPKISKMYDYGRPPQAKGAVVALQQQIDAANIERLAADVRAAQEQHDLRQATREQVARLEAAAAQVYMRAMGRREL